MQENLQEVVVKTLVVKITIFLGVQKGQLDEAQEWEHALHRVQLKRPKLRIWQWVYPSLFNGMGVDELPLIQSVSQTPQQTAR